MAGNELSGKVALVTGASRGIGRAIAVALARRGAIVAVNYKSDLVSAERTVSLCGSAGQAAACFQADVSHSQEVLQLVATVADQLGAIDILVNNAGIAKIQRMEAISETDWHETIDVNLKSAFLVTQAVLPSMCKRKWGRILNIASLAAQAGGIVGPHYAASKAGMIGITHYVASAFMKDGITCNAIAPAVIETDMATEPLRERARSIGMGRMGSSDEIGEAACMILANGFMNGQTVNINGGIYMSS